MKANNLFAKPVVKAVFFILMLLGLVNLGFLLTRIQPLSDLSHISISVSMFIMAGMIMSRNIFIKYNSEDAVIEIERAGLFSSKNTIHSGQLGFVKAEVRNFEVENTWYGGAFTLEYTTSSGRPYQKRFPILFASSAMLVEFNDDLRKITNATVVQPSRNVELYSKVLKNSPAFS